MCVGSVAAGVGLVLLAAGWLSGPVCRAPTLTYATSRMGGSSGVVRAAGWQRAGRQVAFGVTRAVRHNSVGVWSGPSSVPSLPASAGVVNPLLPAPFIAWSSGVSPLPDDAPLLVAVNVVRPRCARALTAPSQRHRGSERENPSGGHCCVKRSEGGRTEDSPVRRGHLPAMDRLSLSGTLEPWR